jgi:fatty acid-binding protein DegV
MEDGEIVRVGVARSRGQAYPMMVDKVEDAVGKGRVKIAYVHAGAKQEVEKLKKAAEARLNTVESFIAKLSPALAVHTGPGTADLCYLPGDA